MRIIAGEFRSRRIAAPQGIATRPTSDRLRETLFSVLQPRVAGARFLDLYAGSGANGLEALSRGAREAVFVESAAPALSAIRANVAALGLAGRARVEGQQVLRWLAGARTGEGAFEVIFLDPPYAAGEEYAAALERLAGAAAGLLASEGVVVAEHRRQPGAKLEGKRKGAGPGASTAAANAPAERYGLLHRTRLLEQGDAALSFYRVMESSRGQDGQRVLKSKASP